MEKSVSANPHFAGKLIIPANSGYFALLFIDCLFVIIFSNVLIIKKPRVVMPSENYTLLL